MAAPFASQHTPSFPDALQQLQASVVVSTYQAGRLILLRAQGDLLNTHFCALDKPMGIAARDGRLAIGTACQLLEYRNMPAVAGKIDGNTPHDACFLPRSIHVTGDIDIHELAYADDGVLWGVNTRMSCLCTFDPAYSVVPRWRPPFVTGYDLTDRCHLNGLALRDGRPAYATALGASDHAEGWRAEKACGGVLISVPEGQTLASGLSMPHSPRWHQGQLWVLESGAGTLVRIDPSTGRKTVVAELPGFTRGLDFAGRYAFIGLSQIRETAVFAGLPLTTRVAERHCGVWLVDTQTAETLAFVVFTGSVQEIFGVQVLPYRFPAVLELADPLVRCSYALPDEALTAVAPIAPSQTVLAAARDHHRAGRLNEAATGYRRALELEPGNHAARYHLALALAENKRWGDAEAELRELVAQQPGHADGWNRLGLLLGAQGRWSDALATYEQALQTDRQFALAHVNRAHALFKLGRYREGWEAREWRQRLPGMLPFPGDQPAWRGEPIADQVLLVWCREDDRNALQFARFLPQAARRCRRLVLACRESLRPLLASVNGVADTRPLTAVPSDGFDLQCEIESLPLALGDCMPGQWPMPPYLVIPPYLKLEPQPNTDGRRKIGLCFPPSAADNNAAASRTLTHQLQPLSTVPGFAFYALPASLDPGDCGWTEATGIVDLGPELTDYARAAAVIAQLDLVIAADTPLGHLAAALGQRVWFVLEPEADWRWLHAHRDTPWYPDARVFVSTGLEDKRSRSSELERALIDFGS